MQSRLRSIGAGDHRRVGVSIERDERYSSIPFLDGLLKSINWGQHLEFLLYQAGMSTRSGMLVLLIGSFAMGGYFLGVTLTHRVAPALLFMAITGSDALPLRAVPQEPPHEGVRAGIPRCAGPAGQRAARGPLVHGGDADRRRGVPEPVRGEFAYTVEEQALGIDTRESLVNLSKRVDSLDLRFFVTAVILQRDTGGNLAEILENTARLIRDRFRIFGDIKTFTAQGRLTGWILVALPTCIALFTFVMTPDYFRPMIESESGRMALWVAGMLQLMGILVIRKIVNIKV